MSYHNIHRWGRFVWAEHEKYGRNFMWSAKGTYHRIVGNLWWFKPTAGVAVAAKTVDGGCNS